MKDLIHEICGLPDVQYKPLAGGSINRSFCVYNKEVKYFLKTNDSVHHDFFEKEGKGLNLLRNNCPLVIPKVIKTGISANTNYLLLEWLQNTSGTENSWENFAAGLADLHKTTQTNFGLNEPHYIGTLIQDNTYSDSWASFYKNYRILPFVKKLYNAGAFTKEDLTCAEKVCNNFKSIFPEEKPALLHGDLWSGNFMFTHSGAAIFDPAVYYGHREMDLGMSLLFGGFDNRFYESYNECFPLEQNWLKRVALTQLYPILVHAVLFGSPYVQRARENIRLYQ